MDIEVRRKVEKMYGIYSWLTPMQMNHPGLTWEMAEEDAAAIVKEFDIVTPISDSGPLQWIRESKDDITFLGVKVTLVERKGIRLVFEVVV